MDYVLVAENEEEPAVELPLEEDQTLLLSTVDAQFPGAAGIKFINPSSGAPRGVRLASKKFHPPEKEGGWGDRTYYCVFPKGAEKRKKEEGEEGEPATKEARLIPTPKCTDLIVLGLPWETTEEGLKKYFEDNYGEVSLSQIKMSKAGKSRGFGFVRFVEYAVQKKVLSSRHQIDGRWCDVSLPPSARQGSPKVFVGRLTTAIEPKHLKEYFSTLGDVTDCFIPKPFRGFGFVTFLDPEVAKLACKMENHQVEGVTVHVETASPKPQANQPGPMQPEGRYRGGGGGRDRGGSMRDRGDSYGGDDWRYSLRQDRFGSDVGRGSDLDRGSPWGQGGFGRGDDAYLDSGRGGGGGSGGGINLRGVSPSRLISAIKDAGLANALGLAAGSSGSNNYSSNRGGFSDDRDIADNGYGSSYGRGSRFERKTTTTPSTWGGGFDSLKHRGRNWTPGEELRAPHVGVRDGGLGNTIEDVESASLFFLNFRLEWY